MKEEKISQALVIMMIGIVTIVGLSGCTSNQSTNGKSTLSGTFVGNAEISMFGGMGGTTTLTQITFHNNIAELVQNSQRGTFSMNYTYSINENTLVLEPTFTGGFPGGQLGNGSRPWNGTRPPTNGTWPGNGTRPSNWTRPDNGTWQPGNGRPSMSITFEYYANEDYTSISLNEAVFNKVQ